MSTSVYIRMNDGRLVQIAEDEPTKSAEDLRAELQKWLASGQRLTVTTHRGTIEEITPRGVKSIEFSPFPNPTKPTNLDVS